LLVSERDPEQRIRWSVAFGLPLPLLWQSALAVFPAHSAELGSVTVLLFLAPAIYLLFLADRRARQLFVIGGIYVTLGIITSLDRALVANAAFSILLLAAAYLFVRSSAQVNRGVLAASGGLALWGLIFPFTAFCSRFGVALPVSRGFLEWPIFLMIGGVLLTQLEEHVIYTERCATHDPLTDLPNRRMFEERLLAVLEDARVQKTTIACLVIDIDNFKTVNDTLGHAAGDQLLRALAVRLAWYIGPRDLLARTGGDEFTVLLGGVHDEHHLKFVASTMMSAASVPVLIDGLPVEVGISIGIALSPDHGDDTDSLCRAADKAMYSAKRRGGSLLAFAGDE
jgi:diguanylate cyclase (GGDEF)-like protein